MLKKIVDQHQGERPEVIAAQTFVLRATHLSWLKNVMLRRIAINLIGLVCCLLYCRKNIPILKLSFAYLKHLPPTVSLRERIKIARIVLRNIGIYELISHCDNAENIVVLDEGILHIVHYLFVYESISPDIKQVDKLLSQIPIPDAVILVSAPKRVLIERTVVRGHERIRAGSFEAVEAFISHALEVFECITASSEIRPRLVAVNSCSNVKPVVTNGYQNSDVNKIIEILISG
ncbi:hypothetical protein [Vibrio sp. YIC-376]|uniref:hypothetical protein n=1 Tax=Vibrio sp. YIC-376 TaxID=3136162 RepID=UPI00402A8343